MPVPIPLVRCVRGSGRGILGRAKGEGGGSERDVDNAAERGVGIFAEGEKQRWRCLLGTCYRGGRGEGKRGIR